ncbi:hypothetical protein C3K47_02065 [Solitalea longa]|uniref:Uncharacterized protein n=2 Tax=Solitalea longa TaxID=2079460 RepID=A0A2S5A9S0_9SPHI|nr:hypothetical protein C3K47_02065 [Solitalea longa]
MTLPIANKNSVFKKLASCLICGLTLSALILLIGNGGNIPWFPASVVFPLVGIVLVASLFFPFIWQYLEKQQKITSDVVYGVIYSIIRFAIAINIAAFGWKKVFGLQFLVPEEPTNQ